MTGQIPREFITQLVERTDIVDVIGEHLQLRKSGRNYSGLCPFHEEKTPSFSVNSEKQFYYCFGCQASGDVLQFVREHRRLDFIPAVEYLASRLGIEVPREAQAADNRQRTLKPLYMMLERAMRFYEEQLASHPQRQRAQSFLQQRGLKPETAGAFHLGFAPPGRDRLLNLLKTENPKQLRFAERIGLLRLRDGSRDDYYDYFRNRIVFPIRDTRGRTVGFGGRTLRDEEHPKYLNSPETPLFHKRRLLYGLHEALQAESRPQRLLLVEGYVDVMTLHQHGMPCAVAALGTSPSKEHLELAFRRSSELTFCFDGDRAGRQAAERQLENALSGIRDGRIIRFLFLPEGEDPDSLVRKRGIEALAHLLERDSVPLSEFLFQHLQRGLNLEHAEGRAALSARAMPYLKRVPQSVFKTQLEQKLAGMLSLERRELQDAMRHAGEAAGGTARLAPAAPGAAPPAAQTPAPAPAAPAPSAPPPPLPPEAYAEEPADPAASAADAESGGNGAPPQNRGYTLQQRMIGALLQRLELAAGIPEDSPLLDGNEEGLTLKMLCEYRRLNASGSGPGLLGDLEYLQQRAENDDSPLEAGLRTLQDWRRPERERILHHCRRMRPETADPERDFQAILERLRRLSAQRQKREEVSALIRRTEAAAELNPETGDQLREGFRRIRESKKPG